MTLIEISMRLITSNPGHQVSFFPPRPPARFITTKSTFFFSGCIDKIPANVCGALARLNLCATLYNITLKYCVEICGFCKGDKS